MIETRPADVEFDTNLGTKFRVSFNGFIFAEGRGGDLVLLVNSEKETLRAALAESDRLEAAYIG